jgi:metal-responsive CopG/Arc/MetJ family transcriptional regulator
MLLPLTHDKQLQVRVKQDFLDKLDNWRREQPDLPSRTEAIRRLAEQALAGKTKWRARQRTR